MAFDPSLVRLGALSFTAAPPVQPRGWPRAKWVGGAVVFDSPADLQAWEALAGEQGAAWLVEDCPWCQVPACPSFGQARPHLDALATLCCQARDPEAVLGAYATGYALAEAAMARAPRLYALACAGACARAGARAEAGLSIVESASMTHNGGCVEPVRHQTYNVPPAVAAACRLLAIHRPDPALQPLCEGRCVAGDLAAVAGRPWPNQTVQEWVCTVVGRVFGIELEETMNRHEYHEDDPYTVPKAVRDVVRHGLMLQRIHGVRIAEGQIRAGRRLLHGSVSYAVVRGLAGKMPPRCGLDEESPTPQYIHYLLYGGRLGLAWARGEVEARARRT